MPPERSVSRSTLRKSNSTDTVRKPPKTTNKKLDILVFAVVIAHGGDFFDVSCLKKKETNKQCSEDAVVNLSTSVLTRNIHLYSNIPYGHYNLTTPCKNLQPVFSFSDVIYCDQHSRGEKLALQEELINEALKKPLLPGTSNKLDYIIDNLNSLSQTQNSVEHLRFDNKTPSEKYEWKMRPLVTEVYFFNEYPSKAAKAPLKSISEMPLIGRFLSYNVTEKDDDISGIFIYTYDQRKRTDITDLSQFEALNITIRDKSLSLFSLIRKYIEWWNYYVKIISAIEIEKNKQQKPFGTYFADQLTHFNLIKLSPNGRRITKINNESVYHLVNIILNFQTYDVHLLSKKIINTVIDFFSIKFLNKEEFIVQSNFFLNNMCHYFNVDLHIFNNACRTKITPSQPNDYQYTNELSSLQQKILTAREEQNSQSQPTEEEVGGKKIKTRKYKK